MKQLFTLCAGLLSWLAISAQTQNPVNWSTSYKSLSATEGEVVIVATIDKGWHTYSQKASNDGPVATSFSFPALKHYELVGKTEESPAHEEFDAAFGAKTFSFSDKAEFHQKIRLTGKGAITISFKVEYMCCDNRMCLPPKTVELSVKTQ